MRSKLIAIGLLCLTLAGCINLYTRCPGTDDIIENTYQSTCKSMGAAYVVAFPQTTMGWEPSIESENLITIPFGLLVLCDTPFEVVMDTVCWPWDSYISDKRKPSSTPSIPSEEEVAGDF